MTSRDRTDNPTTDSGLCELDARALDALIDAGFDLDAVEPELRARAGRIAGLLGALDEPSTGENGVLTEGVMARIHETREHRTELCPRDSEALESCVMLGFRPARAPGSLRDRAERHEAIRREVVAMGPSNEQWVRSGRTDRVDRVMHAVTSADLAPIPFERSGLGGFRLTDLVAAAAVLLLVTAFSLPVLGSFTEESRRAVCQANLRDAGLGLGLYAMSNNDALPMATAGFGGSWTQVGNPGRSHSANLFTLVRTKHVPSWSLACPGNEHAPSGPYPKDAEDWGTIEEVSYSYRLMPRGTDRLHALSSDAVVLADRSPVLLAGLRGQRISPEAPSPNHGREGQHLLRVDDSVRWTVSPVLDNGDNIWLPRAVEEFVHTVRKKYGYIDGYELPASAEDTFLGP